MAKKKPAAKATAKAASKPAAKAGSKAAKPKVSAKPTPKNKANFALTPKDRSKKSAAAKPQAKVPAVVAKPEKATTGSLVNVFSPLADRIIVEEVKTERRTPGGLYIPDSSDMQEGPKTGKVLAVGPGHYDKKGRLKRLDVKAGDTVLFETFMGQPLKIGDREVTVLRESYLLGIVND